MIFETKIIWASHSNKKTALNKIMHTDLQLGLQEFQNSYIQVNEINIARKVYKYGVSSGPYFPVLGLNTEIYGVNLRI